MTTPYNILPAIVGHQLRFGLTDLNYTDIDAADLAGDFPATLQLALEPGCDISAKPQLINADEELNASRDPSDEPMTDGLIPLNGRFSHKPRPDELKSHLLAWAFGGTWTGNTLNPGTLPSAGFSFDRKVKLHNSVGCKVDQCTIRASVGQAMTMEMMIEGLVEIIATSASFPTLSLSTLQPFTLHEAAFTLDGIDSRPVNNIQIGVNNNLVKDHYFNSIYRTQLPEGQRVTTFSCDNPFTASEWPLMADCLTGVSGKTVFTNGVYVLTFEFPALRATPVAPAAPGKGQEMPLRLQFTARKKSGNSIPGACQITLVTS